MRRRATEESTTQPKKARKLTTENDAPSSERQVTDATDQQNVRPCRSNRGKGGAIAQLQAVSDRIHTQRVRKPRSSVLKDVPINKMAPPEKGRRTAKAAVHPRPSKPDLPLRLNAPNPTFIDAQQNSVFGFKAPSDIVPDSDVDIEEEGVESAEEHLAQEVHSNNDDDDDMYYDEPLIEIDENSPDEDERQALQALRAPRKILKKMIVSASESEHIENNDENGDENNGDENDGNYDGNYDEHDNENYNEYNNENYDEYNNENHDEYHNENYDEYNNENHDEYNENHDECNENHDEYNNENYDEYNNENYDDNNDENNDENNGSYAVLKMHQMRNGSIRPPSRANIQENNESSYGKMLQKNGSTHRPKPIPHRNHGETSRANTHGDREIADRLPRLNPQTTSRTMLHRSNNTSRASHHQPVGHRINQVNLGANNEIDDSNNNDADDEHEDEDAQAERPKQRRSRTSNDNIRPSQLRFYSGTWIDVLIAAKNNYRLFIHNVDPFPERTAASLDDARDCLLDAIGKFKEESQHPLEDDIYNQYSTGMTLLVFEDGSTYRGRLKLLGRSIVKIHYEDTLQPNIMNGCNSDQAMMMVRDNVAKILNDSSFLISNELDENGRPSNFAHKAIIELSKQFYYSGKADCLSVLFPAVFGKSLPKHCLAMICTCIVNCLEEWESGSFQPIPFTGARYEAVHKAMMELISNVEMDNYHGRKLRLLLKGIATTGFTNLRKNTNLRAGQFKVRLE